MITRELQLTADGSHTLFIPEMDEHYHSVNGAIQESRHVFIETGLKSMPKKEIRVLEIGFGTGLNAFLTWLETEKSGQTCYYATIERFPLDPHITEALNYAEQINPERKEDYQALHTAAWDEPICLSNNFTLHKLKGDSNQDGLPDAIDVVYFDAFAPEKQPEMWNQAIFDRLFAAMQPGGVLTTYCAKGVVRRMMQKAGYTVERIPGPPGKREMLRARKL